MRRRRGLRQRHRNRRERRLANNRSKIYHSNGGLLSIIRRMARERERDTLR